MKAGAAPAELGTDEDRGRGGSPGTMDGEREERRGSSEVEEYKGIEARQIKYEE